MASVRPVRPALFICSSLLLAVAALARDPTPAPRPRSAQVLGEHDLGKEFNVDQLSSFGRSSGTFRTKTARNGESFRIEQKFQPKSYSGKDFKTKSWSGDFQFSTKEADTKGKYAIPNARQDFKTKTNPVKDAREAGKIAATRDLPDGSRPYLGKEAKKMKTPLDPNNLPKITNSMQELKTIEDVKALLNKN